MNDMKLNSLFSQRGVHNRMVLEQVHHFSFITETSIVAAIVNSNPKNSAYSRPGHEQRGVIHGTPWPRTEIMQYTADIRSYPEQHRSC